MKKEGHTHFENLEKPQDHKTLKVFLKHFLLKLFQHWPLVVFNFALFVGLLSLALKDVINDWQAESYITLSILIIVIELLMLKYPQDLVMLSCSLILQLFNIVGPKDAWAGFSDPNLLVTTTNGMISSAVRNTKLLQSVFIGLGILGRPKFYSTALLRLLLPVVALVFFGVSNGVIVGTLVPVIDEWCNEIDMPKNLFLIPFSFTIIESSTLTMIGPNGNFIQSQLDKFKMKHFGIFALTPMVLIGITISVTFFSLFLKRILYGGKISLRQNKFKNQKRKEAFGKKFIVTVRLDKVGNGEKLATLIYPIVESPKDVIDVMRNNFRMVITDNLELQNDDILHLHVPARIVEKIYSDRRFSILLKENKEKHIKDLNKKRDNCLWEVVLEANCPLLNHPLSNQRCRKVYEANILAMRPHYLQNLFHHQSQKEGHSKEERSRQNSAASEISSSSHFENLFNQDLERGRNIRRSNSCPDLVGQTISIHKPSSHNHPVGLNEINWNNTIRSFKEFQEKYQNHLHHEPFNESHLKLAIREYINHATVHSHYKLKVGDALIIESSYNFHKLQEGSGHFALVRPVGNLIWDISGGSLYHKKDVTSVKKKVICALIIIVQVLSIIFVPDKIFVFSLLAVAALIITRCITVDDAYRSINLRILLTKAAAGALSKALGSTEVAGKIADSLVFLFSPMGNTGVYAAIFFVSVLLGVIISQTSIIALMVPICLRIHDNTKTTILINDSLGVVIVATGLQLLSPFSHTANLLAYSQGGYTFRDFLYVGLPIVLMTGVVNSALAPYIIF